MVFVNELLKNQLVVSSLRSLVTILIIVIIYKIITNILVKSIEGGKFKIFENKKTKTYVRLVKSINRYIFIIITFLLILQIFGVNISSVIAGVGVLGVVFGLAIQDFLKDIIRGSSILSDNYFIVGDIVKYKDIEGKVIVIGLKTTKIQDLRTSNIVSIANRNIEEIQVVSNLIYVKVPMPYELPITDAEEVINDIIESVKKCDTVDDCKYKGVTELSESSVQYLLEVSGEPKFKLQRNRDTLRQILLVFEKYNIDVPYKQIDIHEK